MRYNNFSSYKIYLINDFVLFSYTIVTRSYKGRNYVTKYRNNTYLLNIPNYRNRCHYRLLHHDKGKIFSSMVYCAYIRINDGCV